MTAFGRARRARRAVALLFLANGTALTSVLPRLPEIKSDLGLTNAALGLALAAAAAGSIVGGPVTGRLIHRFGSAAVAASAGAVIAITLPLLGLAPGWTALAGVYLVLGASDGIMDAAMNGHGLRVQQAYDRSLISGFHGVWSAGAALGAVIGTVAAAAGVPLPAQLAGVSVLVLGAVLLASAWRLPGPDPADLTAPADEVASSSARSSVMQALRPLAWVSLMAVLAGVPEDVANAWSVLYLAEEREAAPGVAGLGYTVFAVAMMISRFSADRVTDRAGAVRVARWGGLVACAGYVLVLTAPVTWLSIMGFALVALGIAPAFPTLFHAGGHWPGVRSGDGVTVVSWVARLGFLVTPPLVGTIADNAGIAAGLTLGAVAALLYAALAGRLATAR